MEDTWTNRDLPVLKAAVELYNRTGMPARASAIAQAAGLDEEITQRALRFLLREPFFEDKGTLRGGDQIIFVGAPTGAALRVAGAWPTPENMVERLIAAFEAAAHDSDRSESERRRFTESAELLRPGSPGSPVAVRAFGGGGKTIS
ncbi:hypothetical protein [Mycobacterium avium]|uniref:hypothetical protein n=1 Tax=Mycobacterium avium TaxID=1764 RepID=UPI000A020177|nr:hypothetical protein [Mycobacterium avium]